MKTIAKISEETLRIINYLQDVPHGQYLTYDQIQKDTGVNMDNKGKGYLRTACKKLKRLYSCNIGHGINLIDEKTATTKLVHDNIKIGRTTNRARRAQKIIVNDFYQKLRPEEQKLCVFYGACYGAIASATRKAKHYLENTTVSMPPMLPENIK